MKYMGSKNRIAKEIIPIMKVEYNVETLNKPINTTMVEVIVEQKPFNKMWKEADKRLKSSINRFYKNFIKNL